ncbi:FG-GAP repeat domain-containing protein [Streptomyces wuyuanensis]|uniref:FG-GAP repeat domain-containing protein n=1 Tax=Streptomyces wuyuanensis TaxID=1196353 RepID=UPI00371B7D60
MKVGSGWKGWTIIGAADLTGDGHGDLPAREAGGEVWRYDGTGTGTFKPRKLVFSDWGAGREEIVVVGGITGDGILDLLSRDTNGTLLRNKGEGKGLFGATVTVGTGVAALPVAVLTARGGGGSAPPISERAGPGTGPARSAFRLRRRPEPRWTAPGDRYPIGCRASSGYAQG